MICATCIAANRPAKGTPLPHFCEACGWALVGPNRVRPSPEPAFLLALCEVTRERARGVEDSKGRTEALVRAIETVTEGEMSVRKAREEGAE